MKQNYATFYAKPTSDDYISQKKEPGSVSQARHKPVQKLRIIFQLP